MKTFIRMVGMAVLLLAASSLASAGARVTYVATEKMTDVPRFSSDRESMEIHFRETIEKLAEKLPAGQQLNVEFLDIDLAGDQFPRVAVQDVRVLKGRADWPRMHLRYTLEENGQVIKSGEPKLSDPNYLMSSNLYNNEQYSHEKQMLEDWFRKDLLGKSR